VVEQLLEWNPQLSVYVLVRDLERWKRQSTRFGRYAKRLTAIRGDITMSGIGLDEITRTRITREITAIVHAAADTNFSRELEDSRGTNTIGTANMLQFASDCRELVRFSYVSTAYVAGKATGTILERDNGTDCGWVNSYERSKYEAERLVRMSGVPWTIFRPSTAVCQGVDGRIQQINAVHRALRIYHSGLAAMMPGEPNDSLDVITADYVTEAIARLTLDGRAAERTIHLCSGRLAATLGELLDTAYEVWERDSAWKKRRLTRPILTDLETYTMFESAVKQTANRRLCDLISSLSHFVPQLALPKIFDTTSADDLLEAPPLRPRAYWQAMLTNLLASGWGTSETQRAA
jgi:long-chain acyl-CoA synthetase